LSVWVRPQSPRCLFEVCATFDITGSRVDPSLVGTACRERLAADS